MCIIVVILNLIAFLHSGLVTIRDTEAIIRPQTSDSGTSKFMSCFTPSEPKHHSVDSIASRDSSHAMTSAQSQRSLRSAFERTSIYSSASVDDSPRLGLDLDRLDRER